ncbi:chromate transporter [Calderihabitans maritimus]|uniref:Chromate transporter n=1 Tax=Calderihabitans maritimus TaxID=1246530 RepID=A0A1Z5HWM5_9FIRM|nr:chromate transporter [Calderihabitans maritimus]GAW93818.1 Chromate transporter [Calderihabitans maritimus]
MLLLRLFFTYVKIGTFSIGGGYAMIPLLEKELVKVNHWLTMDQLVDIIALSQMTPGPISINSATFIGYKLAGIPGSLVATGGMVLPPILMILLIARFFFRFQELPVLQAVFRGLRPMVVALILAAGVSFARNALIDVSSVVILVSALFGVTLLRFHPILVILLSGLVGLVIYLP